LLNNLFARLSQAKAEDVSGGIVSYTIGGELVEHPVHIKLTYDEREYFISFAYDTPISIEKSLFVADPNFSTERARIQLIVQIDKIRQWQRDRMEEGIVLTFSYPQLGRKLVKKVAQEASVIVERPLVIQRPLPPRPVPNKAEVSPALQRHPKKVANS
jgi:hypothetical protein